MARGLFGDVTRIARAAQRAHNASVREQQRRARAAESSVRRQAALTRQLAKAERQAYLEDRAAEADEENRFLAEQLRELEGLLTSGLARNPTLDFRTLVRFVDERDLGHELDPLREPRAEEFFPEPLTFLQRLIPGAATRHERRAQQAKVSFERQREIVLDRARRRTAALAALKAEVDAFNHQVTELKSGYESGEPEATAAYFDAVLQRSEYPDGFPQTHLVAFVPTSKQLVVDIDLPTVDEVIPIADRYRYVKSNDEIVEVKRSEKSRQLTYSDVVAKVVLRCLHEVFASDQAHAVETCVLNAFLPTIDPSTGRAIRPCLVSVRATVDQFTALDLRYVQPAACLKQLKASVSRQPSELVAVKPIVDINMVDPRFIKEADVLSTLDQRPNLMDLTPSEFESLITNLFQQMGLETKLTQASRDGGVDCVAFDARPILGGKVVIQAKRYKHTVGVSAVRDLFGTMHNEGASKGILVTTSGFGKAAFEFANGKPMELIAGGNLLYLLKEHAGVDAKIEAPEEWHDPPSSYEEASQEPLG